MEVVVILEKSLTVAEATDVKVYNARRQDYSFKRKYTIEMGEIIDSSVMHLEALKSFVVRPSLKQRKKYPAISSSKATMMKVSDQLFWCNR
jgi:isocitrate dehydrogenase